MLARNEQEKIVEVLLSDSEQGDVIYNGKLEKIEDLIVQITEIDLQKKLLCKSIRLDVRACCYQQIMATIEKMDDQKTLQDIVKNPTTPLVMSLTAIQKIKDQQFLKRIAFSKHPLLQENAIRCITDANILIEIYLSDNSRARCIALLELQTLRKRDQNDNQARAGKDS